MKNNLQVFLITAFFVVAIFGFMVYHITGSDRTESVLENRSLAQRPDFTVKRFLEGDYSKRFETYFNDQFPFRDFFVEANAMLKKYIARQNVIEDIYIADDGYMLAKVEKQNAESAKKVADKVNDFAGEMEKIGVNVYTALMPNKSTMMQKKFPSYYKSYGQENMDLLYEHLQDVSNPIDSREIIEEHMNEREMFFYTDHHWQSKAAFYGYQSVMSYILKHEKMSDEEVYNYDDYSWELKGRPFLGPDARKTTGVYAKYDDQILVAALKAEVEPFYMKWGDRERVGVYDEVFFEGEDPYINRYQAYLGGDYALLTVYNENKLNGTNTLVIKDSYANAFIQFLVPHYSEVHVMDLRHYKGIPIKKYVKENNIDHIVLLNNVNSIYVTPELTNF